MSTETEVKYEAGTFEGKAVAKLSALISSNGISTGSATALRRFDPVDRPGDAALEVCSLLDRVGIDASPGTPAYESWSMVLHCLALVRGNHLRAVDVGTALVKANVSEARVRQLLESDRPMLFDLLPPMARRPAPSSQAMDWVPMTRLALSVDTKEQEAQRARLAIAHSFQRALSKAA